MLRSRSEPGRAVPSRGLQVLAVTSFTRKALTGIAFSIDLKVIIAGSTTFIDPSNIHALPEKPYPPIPKEPVNHLPGLTVPEAYGHIGTVYSL